MKTKISTIILILLSTNIFAQNIVTVHNNNNFDADYTDLQTAIDNANANDTIYVISGGYPNININKTLHLVGAGFNKSNFGFIIANYSSAKFYGTIDSIAIGTTIESFDITSNLTINADDVTIKNCRFKEISFDRAAKNTFIISSFNNINDPRNDEINKNSLGSLYISNTIFLYVPNAYSVTFRNCYFNSYNSDSRFYPVLTNCVIINSIIGDRVDEDFSTFDYCIFDNGFPTTSVSNSYENVDLSDVFENLTADNSSWDAAQNWEIRMQLKNDVSNPAIGNSSDGGNIGVLDGIFPYKSHGISEYPFIAELNVPLQAQKNQPLNVSFKAISRQ